MLVKPAQGPNPLIDFQVDQSSLTYVCENLQRPECILAERDGTAWAADARGAPGGELPKVMNNGDARATELFEATSATSAPVPFGITLACGNTVCDWLASVTFGRPDLSTVYLGGLRLTRIPSFQSPGSGLPVVH